MAKFDPELVDQMRDAMDMRPGISEKRMFGGIFFMLNGNMLCAVTGHGLMFRVGADREKEALLRPGARAMDVTKRPMPGFIRVDVEEALELGLEDWIGYAALYVGGLPLKVAKKKTGKA
jgi:hypothetical protein